MGYCESFIGKIKVQLFNSETFYSPKEAKIVIEQWQSQYNEIRPHLSLGRRHRSVRISHSNRCPQCSNLSLGLVQKLGQVTWTPQIQSRT